MNAPFQKFLKIQTTIILLAQAVLLFNLNTPAQDTRQLRREKPIVNEENRVALVIGNSKYIHTKSLPNPVNDAKDISAKLRQLGFRVFTGEDLDRRSTEKLIREFGDNLLQENTVGLFFYAGHGLQYQGENYIVPTDADIPAEDEIEFEAVKVSLVLRKMNTAKNNLNIIILDACRDNPFASTWRKYRSSNNDGGLTMMHPPSGTVLFYATQPGEVASDGSGRNGLFTEALLKRIDEPNIELGQLMKKVGRDVFDQSSQKQTPWNEGGMLGDFYFNKKENNSSENSPIQTQPIASSQNNPSPVFSGKRQAEENAWSDVKNSMDVSDFKYFLEEFPAGYYAEQAKRRIEQFAWDDVRESNDKSKLQAYLSQFPDGLNAATARIKLKRFEAREIAPATIAKNEIKTETTESVAVREIKVEEKIPAKTEEKRSAKTEEENITVKDPPKISKPKALPKKNPGNMPKVASQTDSLGIEFISIPAGSFMMGSSAANLSESLRMARKDYADFEAAWIENEKPAHRVDIPEEFWMGKTEVTQAQWEKIMGTNPSFKEKCADCPVDRVSWEDAKEFIKKLNELNNGFVYSLPSEAEWEYAARGGTTRLFAGNTEDISWHSGNSGSATNPVASRLPNSFGLYDMNGNVAEWCEDLYERYDKAENPDAPTGPANLRVVRGGHWNVFPTLQRSTARSGLSPNVRNITTGFRLAARLKQ